MFLSDYAKRLNIFALMPVYICSFKIIEKENGTNAYLFDVYIKKFKQNQKHSTIHLT
jgi:hypothetical protein